MITITRRKARVVVVEVGEEEIDEAGARVEVDEVDEVDKVDEVNKMNEVDKLDEAVDKQI